MWDTLITENLRGTSKKKAWTNAAYRSNKSLMMVGFVVKSHALSKARLCLLLLVFVTVRTRPPPPKYATVVHPAMLLSQHLLSIYQQPSGRLICRSFSSVRKLSSFWTGTRCYRVSDTEVWRSWRTGQQSIAEKNSRPKLFAETWCRQNGRLADFARGADWTSRAAGVSFLDAHTTFRAVKTKDSVYVRHHLHRVSHKGNNRIWILSEISSGVENFGKCRYTT